MEAVRRIFVGVQRPSMGLRRSTTTMPPLSLFSGGRSPVCLIPRPTPVSRSLQLRVLFSVPPELCSTRGNYRFRRSSPSSLLALDRPNDIRCQPLLGSIVMAACAAALCSLGQENFRPPPLFTSQPTFKETDGTTNKDSRKNKKKRKRP